MKINIKDSQRVNLKPPAIYDYLYDFVKESCVSSIIEGLDVQHNYAVFTSIASMIGFSVKDTLDGKNFFFTAPLYKISGKPSNDVMSLLIGIKRANQERKRSGKQEIWFPEELRHIYDKIRI